MSGRRLLSLDDAKGEANARLIIEGDWGGTIYLSCPVTLIGASQDEIYALAEWLERQIWECNFDEDGEAGHLVRFAIAQTGDGILGGMGGGIHTDALWMHPTLIDSELEDEVASRLKLSH